MLSTVILTNSRNVRIRFFLLFLIKSYYQKQRREAVMNGRKL
ncbi:hypothetical protein ROSEINA2194_00106 [Roseburia inulinivorans DSM 16841]|uniref:Uncharacterized protein n=1 Tax=Roseburia inulinivorans DSM 16841 TaxID=622312 RepID=C0FN12_9FIRM|nr:hypothetical protein ROSEINA2194_02207 [Roseburia inulinivorans DSM 16841]EEG96083.1 hypothetical protein ROSEINA2194_00106 [Roseburia inulinivorans DSM 16841]